VTLGDYLAQAARTPFRWGERDCCLWIADWLIACGHPDPAAEWRGRYRTAIGAGRILAKRAGLLSLVTTQAENTGLAKIETPAQGDVGVVLGRDQDGRVKPAAAICTGPRWAVLTVVGVSVAPASPLAAWRA
jgi:hypothetical protein